MDKSVSRGQVEWLMYMQTQDICLDRAGNRVKIQHAMNQGEHMINGKPVDGFLEKDGEKFYFEYYGCHHHPGCCVEDSKIQNAAERRYRDQVKQQEMKNQGTLIIMRECQWHDEKLIIDYPRTELGRILLQDTEKSLLKAIQDEEVFGFVVADVTTPDSVREGFGSFLFPPIFQRMDLDESHLSEYMAKVCQEEQRATNFSTLLQTYNCTQQLLMTPLVKLYLDRGLQVFNITKFVQYQPGRGLRPFVNKVVQMRTEAKRSGDEAKSLTSKLFGNSSYGKMGESYSKYRDTKIVFDAKSFYKHTESPLFKCQNEVMTEDQDFWCRELSKLPKKTTDNKPVHLSVAILQHAKILFLKFMWYLFDHLEPGSFRPCYADTDS